MKAIDIVKPAPKTALEQYMRWRNHLQSELRTLPYWKRVKIEVK